MATFQNTTFTLYFDTITKSVDSASRFGINSRSEYVKNGRYICLGKWQTTQRHNLPVYGEGKIWRYLYGKWVCFGNPEKFNRYRPTE
mgnify:CR=1 FL=1